MHKSRVHILLVLALAVALATAGASYAASPTTVPVSDGTSASVLSSGLLYDSSISGRIGSSGNNSDPVFAGYVPAGSNYYLCLGSRSRSTFYIASSGSFETYTFSSSRSDGVYYFFGIRLVTASAINSDIPIYSNIDDMLDIIAVDLINTTSVLSIPRGYALKVSSDADFVVEDVQLSVINSFNFPKISSASSLRTNDSHWGSILDERVVTGASADVGTLVQWLPLNANVLGRASVYRSSSTHSYSLLPDEVFIVTNPSYSGSYVQNESGEINENVPMKVTITTVGSSPVSYSLVPLSQELVVEDGVFHYANYFQPASTISGTVIPGTDDNPSSVDFGDPPAGGADSDQPPLYDNTTLLGIIRGFVNSLVELFNKAVDSINVLVNQGSTFMTRLSELFTWLPAPVYAVIVAALVVAIVLGVIKLLF